MASDNEPQPVSRALTPEQTEQAVLLYRHLLGLRAQGIKLALAHLEDEIGIHAVGRRANVAQLLTTL